MLENNKKAYDYWMAFGFVVVGICFLFSLFGKPGASIDKLQADTDRTMGTIKAEQSSAGAEIDRSAIASGNAIEAIQRSQSEIGGSREAVDNINAGIAKLQNILGECKRIAGESKSILNGVEQSN